jgi:hypothetical protein
LLDPKTYTSSVSGYLVLKVLLAKRKAREVDWSKNERATGRGAREITRRWANQTNQNTKEV